MQTNSIISFRKQDQGAVSLGRMVKHPENLNEIDVDANTSCHVLGNHCVTVIPKLFPQMMMMIMMMVVI